MSIFDSKYIFSCLISPEYSSQLPSEGGAFYTSDTMDSSRPYYKKAWPPILYAASLWLKETGFINVDKDDSRPANMKVDVSDTNRFHLLIGLESIFFTLQETCVCCDNVHLVIYLL